MVRAVRRWHIPAHQIQDSLTRFQPNHSANRTGQCWRACRQPLFRYSNPQGWHRLESHAIRPRLWCRRYWLRFDRNSQRLRCRTPSHRIHLRVWQLSQAKWNVLTATAHNWWFQVSLLTCSFSNNRALWHLHFRHDIDKHSCHCQRRFPPEYLFSADIHLCNPTCCQPCRSYPDTPP